ncbi:hypothetical protein LTR15_008079 [Elasticomyces elasticus]|nr:hypothetical protein LTR15_008079 [Elasticomyces elasticus]
MAPLMDDTCPPSNGSAGNKEPRFLIIGAGSRGTAYAAAIVRSDLGIVAAVAEPITFKRQVLGSRYVWHTSKSGPEPQQEFENWKDFIKFEESRRKDAAAGSHTTPGIDAVFVCVKDDLHCQVVTALAPLGLHIMCEKPLATNLRDILAIQSTLSKHPQRIFAIGHVLRYSPHNMLLRSLLLGNGHGNLNNHGGAIGEVLSIEHTEPVGYWHFSHSYVRGQWRKEKTSAPSLLTKSCHDIDFIMWLMCTPPPYRKGYVGKENVLHLPATISSVGSLKQFRKSRKPKHAKDARNCLSCPIKESCIYSAKRIYYDRHLAKGVTKWPVDIVNPEIPSILAESGPEAAKDALMATLAEDYEVGKTKVEDIESRPWFGRCVWESDNDVCDDQIVTITWDDDPDTGKGEKTAVFHMVAQSLAQCERRGRVYGTSGEIEYDSKTITIHDFKTGGTTVHHPEVPVNSHHGGGDDGLTAMFAGAVAAVENGEKGVQEAQMYYMGCDLEEVVRSHAVVFAAEKARTSGEVVEWDSWWHEVNR